MGLTCLLAALLVFYFSVLNFDYSQTHFFELDPTPDATEYMAGAVSLAQRGTYEIHVAGEFHPPRYPPGYSLLMQPFLWLGADPVKAPFLTNWVFGFATILLVCAGVSWLRGFLAGGLAALLVAAFPMFIILSRSPMSEVSGGFFSLGAFLLFWAGLEKRHESLLPLGAFLLGLTLTIRISNALLLFFLPVVWLLAPKSRKGPLGLALCAAWGVGVLPLLVYFERTFGHPFISGYEYWIPYYGQVENVFGLRYILPNLDYLFRECLQQEKILTEAGIFGLGSYFDLTFPLLAAAGLMVRDRGVVRSLSVGTALYFMGMLFYFFQDARLLWPGFLFLVPLIAIAVSNSVNRLTLKFRDPAGWLLLILLLSHLLGYPNRWAKPELIKYLRTDNLRQTPHKYELVIKLKEMMYEASSMVFTDLEMPYVYVLTGGSSAVYPLTSQHSYRFNPMVLKMDEPRIRVVLGRALEEDREVWALAGDTPLSHLLEHLPLPQGYAWQSRLLLETGRGLARVVIVPQ